jgi:hypothetical protein
VIRQAEAALNAERAARGEPHFVRVLTETYTFENYVSHMARLQTQLMTGQGPDIFALDWHPYWNYALSGFLADIYTLIDQCPYSKREDFYTHVLELFEVEGGLYTFPMNFGIEYMSINAKLPQEFLDRFAQLPVVTLTDMMEIYLDLMRDYGGEYGHLSFGDNVIFNSPSFAALLMSNGFIDYENRTASLTDERFISFLSDYIRIFDGVMLGDPIGGYGEGGFSDEQYEMLSELFVFRHDKSGASLANTYLPHKNAYFIHHTPFVDAQGRLLTDHNYFHSDMWASFCITSAGNTGPSWEFLRHLMYALAFPAELLREWEGALFYRPFYTVDFSTPIVREYFEPYMRGTFEHIFYVHCPVRGFFIRNFFAGMDDEKTRTEAVERAITQRAILNEMDIALSYPFVPEHFFYEPLDFLLRGLITPEAAAQQLQNVVSLWFMEQ